MSATRHLLTRRSVIQGSAATAGTVALASCAQDHTVSGDVNAIRVRRVPADDPDDRQWDRAPELLVELGPQDMALPMATQPGVASLRVRALHDVEHVAFRLEWDDPDADDLTVRVDDFRDACAVMLVAGRPSIALRPMGSATAPATLLHWKADWQRDVDQGRQGLDAVFPNRSVDVYPPLWNVVPGDVTPESYADADAMEWLPGMQVANPISLGGRSTPVEKALAYGFSTTTTAPTQNALGRGVRTARGWRVVIVRPLDAVDDGEAAVRPGTPAMCAFAVWSGHANQAGSRKAPSRNVYLLYLER
jgi:hypothetical protein